MEGKERILQKHLKLKIEEHFPHLRNPWTLDIGIEKAESFEEMKRKDSQLKRISKEKRARISEEPLMEQP